LEKIRALLVNLADRICYEKNIWNLGVIDNIDFKEATFGYGNIFDVTRGNSHATLRMLFQFQLSDKLPNIIDETRENQQIFGPNSFSLQTLNVFNSVFKKLLEYDKNTLMHCSDFDENDI
jgi:hypothetical protein